MPRFKPTKPGSHIDVPLFVIVFSLSVFGTVMVYSGSVLVALGQGLNPYHYFLRQVIWVIAGLTAGYIAFRFDYRKLPKFAPFLLLITFILLILVIVLNWGQPIKRWIDLGPFDLQASEFAKLFFLIYLSCWLAKQKERSGKAWDLIKEHFLTDVVPFVLMLTAVCFLIFIEPDLDTTIILAGTSFLVYFIAGNDVLHLAGSFSIIVVFLSLVPLAIKFASYRLERFVNWRDFWVYSSIQDPYGAGYQLKQILVAVASGGLFGVGFGQSRQKFHYLGETAFSDTIFAIFAEEFGFIGSAILVILFIVIIYRGFKIAKNAPDKLGFLLATSITIWITLQAFLHIASNVALIPINGNTLPFISYGGSSTVVNLIAIGLLLNVSRGGPVQRKKTTSRRTNKKTRFSIRNSISELFH